MDEIITTLVRIFVAVSVVMMCAGGFIILLALYVLYTAKKGDNKQDE